MKTSWNLGLLYKSDKDPQIEKDLKAIESAYAGFEKKYKGKDFTSTPEKLKKALDDSKKIKKIIGHNNPWWYFALRKDLNSDDEVAGSKATLHSQRSTVAKNKKTFFSLAVAKIPKEQQSRFLRHNSLAEYKYLLRRIFETGKYNLSEQEEQLVDLLSQPAYGMWISGQNKLLNRQTIKFKKKDLPISEAISIISSLPKKDRDYLHIELNKILKSISHFAGEEINAIYNFKKIMDERRGFKHPYSSTALSYENEEEEVESLVALVTKNFHIAHRFYKLHAKLIKQKKLGISDRGVEIGKITKKFDFNAAQKLVKGGLAKIDQQYVDIFEKFLVDGQIDVLPRKGKKGGAYCWGGGSGPTYVLLNHTDNIRSVETLAHEMGHAFHTELSKSQPEQYQRYSTATAEVASTFFEQVVGEELEKELENKDKIILLHNKIMGDIATIFRQVAFFNFELELHEEIRSKGLLAKEDIAKLMTKHLKSYLGPAVEVTDDDGYFFVYLSHMRRFFYVYSYAYGQLISKVLFDNWKKDKSYAKKVDQFLHAGGSMSPKDIFKSIGIDTSDPKFFVTGLKAIEKDIDRLEKLAKQ